MPDITLDEMGDMSVAAAAPVQDLTKVTLEGDTVPEHLRGKTAADLVTQTVELQRLVAQLERSRGEPVGVAAPVPVVAAAPVPEPELTQEQFDTLYQESPLKAFELMQERAMKKVEANLAARIAPLHEASASTLEAQMRGRYAEEFELLGPEIEAIKNSLPDKRVLTNPQAWEQLVTYVRGQSVDKIIAHRSKKATDAAAEQARLAAVRTSPMNLSVGSGNSHGAGSAPATDALTEEISRKLGFKSVQEYLKWA